MKVGTIVKTTRDLHGTYTIPAGSPGTITAPFGTDGSWYVWIKGTEYALHPDQIEPT